MKPTVEDFLKEIYMKQREVAVKHRIAIAVYNTKNEMYEETRSILVKLRDDKND